MDILLEQHKDFLLLLLKYEVEFMLIGGYAVIYYGYERTTADMDIWLKPDNQNREKFINALKERGVLDETINRLHNTDFTVHQAMHIGQKPNHIDFLTRVSGVEFSEACLKVVMLPLRDKSIPVIHYNHLIATKIASGRLQDKADVEKLQSINRFRNPPF